MKLDIGSGQPGWQKMPLDEWTHLDIVPHDHVEIVCDFGKIPLDDNSVDEIWIGDVIEHVPVWRLMEVLGEWRRILKVDGTIGGNTPNPERAMREFSAGNIGMDELIGALYGNRDKATEIHYITYSKESLTNMFRRYGFDVTDFSESPGDPSLPWWWRFKGKKVS